MTDEKNKQDQQYDEYVARISDEADNLAAEFCKREGFTQAYHKLFAGMRAMFEGAVERLAIAEDCLKKGEGWSEYRERARRME